MNTEIEKLTGAHAAETARLHASALPDDFVSQLGPGFLERVYYTELLKDPDTSGWCSFHEGKIAGFVFFTSNPAFHRNLFLGRPGTFFVHALKRCWSPRFLRLSLEVLGLLFFRGRRPEEAGAELGYIAVDRACRGQGIGSALVRHGLEMLKRGGHSRCWVKTLASTPETIRFYEGLGFKTCQKFLGRVFLSRAL